MNAAVFNKFYDKFSYTNLISNQSVANIFSDGQIQIWILFAKDIFYKYEYEYYS